MAPQLARWNVPSLTSTQGLADTISYHSPLLHFSSAPPASPLFPKYLRLSPQGLCTWCSLYLEALPSDTHLGHSLASFSLHSNISSLEIHCYPFKNSKPLSLSIITQHCSYLFIVSLPWPEDEFHGSRDIAWSVHYYHPSPQNGAW